MAMVSTKRRLLTPCAPSKRRRVNLLGDAPLPRPQQLKTLATRLGALRKSWIGSDDPRHADHLINALLNWSYAVVAGRLAAQLLARGAYPARGQVRPILARL